jgi:hypothetical protein
MIKDSTTSLLRIKMLRNDTPQEGNFQIALSASQNEAIIRFNPIQDSKT